MSQMAKSEYFNWVVDVGVMSRKLPTCDSSSPNLFTLKFEYFEFIHECSPSKCRSYSLSPTATRAAGDVSQLRRQMGHQKLQR